MKHRPTTNRLDQAVTIDSLVELYRSGMSLSQIAKRFGVSPQAISWRLEKANEPRRKAGAPAPTPDLEREALVEFYERQQLSSGETAARLNVKAKFVLNRLCKHQIARRSPKKAARLAHGPVPTRAELTQLYLVEKKSQAQIARMFGKRQTTISDWLRDYNIKKEIKLSSVKARERRNRRKAEAKLEAD